MRPNGSAVVLENRRREAIRLLNQGRPPGEVAVLVSCHPKSVSRWKKLQKEGGLAALRARPHTGRPAALSQTQKKDLTRRLLKGALKNGFATDLWTCPRIVELIRRHYGVSYHHDHVGRLMGLMGFTCQKPRRRAVERDEDAVQHWIVHDWERIKKKRSGGVPTLFSSTKAAS
jgi:transposase